MPLLEPPKINSVQASNQKIVKLPNGQIPIDDQKQLEDNIKQAEKKISTIMNNRTKPTLKKYVLLDSRKRNTELYQNVILIYINYLESIHQCHLYN